MCEKLDISVRGLLTHTTNRLFTGGMGWVSHTKGKRTRDHNTSVCFAVCIHYHKKACEDLLYLTNITTVWMDINFGAHAHHIGFFQTLVKWGDRKDQYTLIKRLSERVMSARTDIAFTGDAVFDFFVAICYVEARWLPNWGSSICTTACKDATLCFSQPRNITIIIRELIIIAYSNTCYGIRCQFIFKMFHCHHAEVYITHYSLNFLCIIK